MSDLNNILSKIIQKISSLNATKGNRQRLIDLDIENRLNDIETSDFVTQEDLPTNHVSSNDIVTIKVLSESDYDALQTKNQNTLYIYEDDEE